MRSTDFLVPKLPVWQTLIRWIQPDGARVAAGERVVEFDTTPYLARLEELRIAVERELAALRELEADAESNAAARQLELEKSRATLELAAIEASVPPELVARRTHEDNELALERAQLAVAGARDELDSYLEASQNDLAMGRWAVDSARRELAIYEETVETMTLRATRDGMFLAVNHPNEGRKLRAGDAVWVGLAVGKLPDLTRMQVRARLSDVDDRKVAVGMRVACVLDSDPTFRLPGTVAELGLIAEAAAGATSRRFFGVRIEIDHVDPERMRPGMSLKVEVETSRAPSVLVAPRASLDVTASPPLAFLFPAGVAEVRLGPCSAQQCVIEEGLREGQPLARAGASGREAGVPFPALVSMGGPR